MLRSDEFAHEGDKADLPRPLQAFRGDNRLNFSQASIHVVVDQDIIIFGPVTDFAR